MATTCAHCGSTDSGETAPLTWVSSMERGAQRWYCECCARENLRSIEGKLDSEWW